MVLANGEKLSKSALKRIVLCSYIMSGIDGYMDESEFEVIADFTDQHWQDSFGDKEDFYKEIDSEVLAFFVPASGKFEINPDSINPIIEEMTLDEVTILLGLMNDVMEADGIIDPAEVSLFKLIKNHIDARSR